MPAVESRIGEDPVFVKGGRIRLAVASVLALGPINALAAASASIWCSFVARRA